MHAWKIDVESNVKKIMKILNIVKGMIETEKSREKLILHLFYLFPMIS